jgi:hypothetical protein
MPAHLSPLPAYDPRMVRFKLQDMSDGHQLPPGLQGHLYSALFCMEMRDLEGLSPEAAEALLVIIREVNSESALNA